MTALPEKLRHWQQELSVFPEDVVLSLGSMVRVVDALIGPLHTRHSVPSGAPDGYSGLARRGSYERLLTSEWLLAEEAPDEFIRRAAMGEHAFFELARRTPADRRRSVVLFDSGPSQLGSPRLAHLATLIVLARRAAAAGVPLFWGVLQQPKMPLVAELTQTNILHLLQGRTAVEVDEAALGQWRASLTAEDDVWTVGLHDSPGIGSAIQVEDELSVGQSRLKLTVRPRRGSARSAVLELPGDPDRTRLIRDPFETRAARPAAVTRSRHPRIGAATRIVFSQSGRHVSMRLEDGTFATVDIPNSPRGTPGNPRITRLGSDDILVGISVIGRCRAVVVAREGKVRIEGLGKEVSLPAGEAVFMSGLWTPHPCFGFHETISSLTRVSSDSRVVLWITDSNGRLFQVDGLQTLRARDDKRVLAAATRPRELWAIQQGKGADYQLVRLFQQSADAPRIIGERKGPYFRAYLNWAFADPATGPAYAIQIDSNSWSLGRARAETGSFALTLSPGDRAIGLHMSGHGANLITLKADRERIAAVTPQGEQLVVRESQPLLAWAVSHMSTHIAYLTQAHELVVLEAKGGAYRKVMTFAPQGAAS
jgi:hypothetical protein